MHSGHTPALMISIYFCHMVLSCHAPIDGVSFYSCCNAERLWTPRTDRRHSTASIAQNPFGVALPLVGACNLP
ncbi:hypothetical protein GQ53DRAFT_291932 [Thozetella sp. PMI_491]|nr:hypothetical protein GQ53DRAFT_291932 [Thozetella sp. PMI_491]